MIDREHDLSLTRQAEALAISRGSVFYQPHQNSKKAICSFKPLRPGGNHQPCTFSGRALPGLEVGVCQ